MYPPPRGEEGCALSAHSSFARTDYYFVLIVVLVLVLILVLIVVVLIVLAVLVFGLIVVLVLHNEALLFVIWELRTHYAPYQSVLCVFVLFVCHARWSSNAYKKVAKVMVAAITIGTLIHQIQG